jgi:putative ABC transport system permease protein
MKERFGPRGLRWRSWLQPLADVHLYSTVDDDEPRANLYYLYAFAAVALFILLVACINYMNLATARSTKRAREVGMRKILGAGRGALIAQFMCESLLYAAIATVLGLMLVELVFYFTGINNLLNKPLTLHLTQEPELIAYAALFSLGVGLLAGLYPALYLSSWQPLTALVGNKNSDNSSARFRATLVFTQFTITVLVIASAILMMQQMRYVANKDLGFEKTNKLIIPWDGYAPFEGSIGVLQQTETIKNALLQNPRITGVATSSRSILGESMIGIAQGADIAGTTSVESLNGSMEDISAARFVGSMDFPQVMQLQLAEGRYFDPSFGTDAANVIVNEALVRRMGWGDQALGKKIGEKSVIGVVKDFNFASLHQSIGPAVIHTNSGDYRQDTGAVRIIVPLNLVVSVSGEDLRDTITFIEQTLRDIDPARPFQFAFLDDLLDTSYQSETNLMQLIGIFATLCIFISCLGLYGLAAFTTEQRTREIGIRKVLGASSWQIIALLSRKVLDLVLAGALLGSLLAWLAINKWLSSFAYRAGIDPLAFVIATLAALAIAYATIALQSYKAARGDPAQALHYE